MLVLNYDCDIKLERVAEALNSSEPVFVSAGDFEVDYSRINLLSAMFNLVFKYNEKITPVEFEFDERGNCNCKELNSMIGKVVELGFVI